VDKHWLRSPAGQLSLLGATFLAALGLALAMATQRWFFERYIVEKYRALPAQLAALPPQLTGAEAAPLVTALPAADREALYEGWMQADDWPAGAPAALSRADPELYLRRVKQTLLCGSDEQRRRGVRFLTASGHPEAAGILRRTAERARARREEAFADFCIAAGNEPGGTPP
jgi:hypothetical protein